MKNHLIIIGGVAAGAKAAAKARRLAPDLKITIYTKGEDISYSACGMPYFIENIIKEKKELIVRTPQRFKEKENVDVKIRHEVVKIFPEEKKVQIKNLNNGEIFEDEYSKLLIASGARAFVPDIEGVELENVFVLKEVDDAINIKEMLQNVKSAVIIGGGYIGMEMTEALITGIKNNGNIPDITVIDRLPQLLNTFDEELASQIESYLTTEIGVKIIKNISLKKLIGDEKSFVTGVETSSGEIIPADIVILALGVKPNVEFAEESGVIIGETGAIKTNRQMKTNLVDVYAAGDCVETTSIVTGKRVWVPLGSTANKMGRVAAINITGGKEDFKGVTSSMVVKIFDYTASKTGINEKEAKLYAYNYITETITHHDKSGYMPDAEQITLKMIADVDTGRILGLQAIGKGDADKRVNIVSVALLAEMTLEDFINVDLTYAPPYSSAIDLVLILAQNLYSKFKKLSATY